MPGFVVNRLLFPFLFEAVRLADEAGLEPEAMDSCMKLGAGHPMGPLALLDFVGLDVAVAIGEQIGAEVPARVRELADAGGSGRKTGSGFYEYARRPGARPAGDVAAMSQTTSASPMPCAAPAPRRGPRELGVGQVVPAGVVERFEGAGERGADLTLGPDQSPNGVTLGIAEPDAPHRQDLLVTAAEAYLATT